MTKFNKTNAIDAGRIMAESARDNARRAISAVDADIQLQIDRCNGDWSELETTEEFAAWLLISAIIETCPNVQKTLKRKCKT